MKLAPVVLFVYNRVNFLSKTIEYLKRNELADKSELIIFSDAPKNENDIEKVKKVRDYIKNIDGFKDIKIIEREKNFGLGNNIIDGVTEIVNQYGRIIVLEDDLITSPYFLRYINEGLNLYEEEERVASIHGYIYSIKDLPDTFFIRGADCLGWGTWKRAWDIFEKDGNKLYNELKIKKLTNEFDFKGGYPYTKMLKDQIKGKNNSWAIRWYAAVFLKDMLTLYPGRSYVYHIGFDKDSTNTKYQTKILDSELNYDFKELKKIEIKENKEARKKFEKFFSSFIFKYRVEIIMNYIKNILPGF